MIAHWFKRRVNEWLRARADIPRAEAALPPTPVPQCVTYGVMVGDEHGRPVWIGHPDRTDSPTMTVYDDVTRVRRRLTSIFKGTLHATGQRLPLTMLRVRIVVEAVSDPIVPKLRSEEFEAIVDEEAPFPAEKYVDRETLPLPFEAPHE